MNQYCNSVASRLAFFGQFFWPGLGNSPPFYSTVPLTGLIMVIIPTYRPNQITLRLIRSIIRYNRRRPVRIIVVDDCSETKNKKIFKKIKKINNRLITVIRTPTNQLKAAALNHALSYIEAQETKPTAIITLDDDIVINKKTIPLMIECLKVNSSYGAVCSLARVANKSKNILTRLQGLEYDTFNVIRIADTNFFGGPLVMPGMLTAFRYEAIKTVGGFAPGHLIEDYEITVRLKERGWLVGLAQKARAYTVVPETIGRLWRQRIRWTYGGLLILLTRPHFRVIIQDVIGHFFFISTLALVILLFFLYRYGSESSIMIAVFYISTATAIINYLFYLIVLVNYESRDALDYLIRAFFLVEMAYSLLLSFVLLGSYIFLVYTLAKKYTLGGSSRISKLDDLFQKIGFSERWGTR